MCVFFALILSSAAYSQSEEMTMADKDGISNFLVEERLANDFYLLMNEKWDIPLFNKISNSEVENLMIVQNIVDTYGLDQYNDDENNHNLQFEYLSLIENGNESVVDALLASAMVEEMDIIKLDKLINATSSMELVDTYRLLKKLSEQHLRAITIELDKYGVDYIPEIIEPDHYKSLM
jgi:hypothetical protein